MTTILSPLLTAVAADTVKQAPFRADDGNQEAHRRGRARMEDVDSAWKTLMQLRASTGGTGLPSPWELARPIQAAALALEAASCTPSAVNEYGSRVTPGYSVCATSDAGTVRISFKVPARWEQVGSKQRVEPELLHGRATRALSKYRRVLQARGWDVTAHRMDFPQAYLLATPCTP